MYTSLSAELSPEMFGEVRREGREHNDQLSECLFRNGRYRLKLIH